MKSNANILLIEDDVDFRKTLVRALKKEGYLVSGVQNGEQALQLANENKYNLIISDIRLPGSLNGIQTVKRIKELNKDFKPQVIIMTGFVNAKAEKEANAVGFEAYLKKPFTIEYFLQCVKKCLVLEVDMVTNVRTADELVTKNISSVINFDETKNSLLSNIKRYVNWSKEIKANLKKHPQEWGRYQVEFNAEINRIFSELMIFEKKCYQNNEFEKLKKLKRIFVEKIRAPFERGDYIKWVIKKPYGYAGDFKFIEDIYENNPQTMGYDRLFDNYTMMSAISSAVRNRKNDFKKMVVDYAKQSKKKQIVVMNLASGPCREIWEIKREDPGIFNQIIFHCYDSDEASLDFARKRLKDCKNISYINQNAAKIALKKDITKMITEKYDIIYSTGLFDYFEDKIALRLIANLKKLLADQGILVISDVRDKYSNPSFHFMEWIGDWPLVYRDDDNFRGLFIKAGFLKEQLEISYEQQGILQYIKAFN